MKKTLSFLTLVLMLFIGTGTGSVFAAPSFKKVLIVVLENTDYSDALKQPQLANLAKQGALLTNFHAEVHPSQPNYIALVSGDTHGVDDNDSVDLNVKHIGDLLEAKGKSWKSYAESYPGKCFTGSQSGLYVRKHNPMISFLNVQKSPARCARMVSAVEFEQDVRSGQLPDFSLYIPDLKNDGHDTGVDYAGRWLAEKFLPEFGSKLPKDVLLVVTFDESASKDNRIYTVLLGDSVKPGARSDLRYDHYSLLRTIENQFALGTLGAKDEKATPIRDVFR